MHIRRGFGLFCCAAIFLATTVSLSGQVPVASVIHHEVNQRLSLTDSEIQSLTLAPSKDADLAGTIVLGGRTLTLELDRHSLRSPDFQVLVQVDASGELLAVDPPPVTTYQGRLREIPLSDVRAGYADGRLTARIHTPDGVYGVQPLSQLELGAPPDAHVVYRGSAWNPVENYTCGTTGHEAPAGVTVGDIAAGQRRAAGVDLSVAELAIDSDFDFYSDNGQNVNQTIQSIETFFNGVEGVYEEPNVGITYEIIIIIVRTVSGSPYTTNDPGGLLDQFASTWSTAPNSSIHRDVAHLMTGKNLSGSIIGIAQLSGVCSLGTGYGLSENFSPNLTSMVGLISHELGHNWSAPHCNGSNPCRIMCSGLGGCNGLDPLTFEPVSANLISDFKDSAGCISAYAPPLQMPFCEQFDAPPLDDARWSFIKGAGLSVNGNLEPSEPFALELDASSDTEFGNDEIRSNYILLAGESNVVLSYYTQHKGVEAGERLFVEYFSDDGLWVELNEIVSNGVDDGVFHYHEHVLPGGAGVSAYHNEFRFRFRPDVSSTSDDWFIDDVSLDCLPPFVCQAGCTDGFACTTGDHCVSNSCVGTAVNCSGAGGPCVVAACDPGGSPGNCSVLTPANEGAPCNAGAGICQAGTCLDPAVTARAFLAADGEEDQVSGLGATTVFLSPGSPRSIMIWLADHSGPGSLLNGYQLMLPMQATPQVGATGTVGYVNNNPGVPGDGDSVNIDVRRSDWIFADEPVAFFPNYSEAPQLGLFGVLYTTVPGTGIDPSTLGTRYLAEFRLSASFNASGEFDLPFNLAAGSTPPFTTLFAPTGAVFQIEQFQPLHVVVGPPGGCLSFADCADADDNGIRDDNCIWWACQAGICSGTDIVFADMGGQFGDCPPDGTADANDKFHSLTCFANVNEAGQPGYPCEDGPPAAFNVDAGGQFGACDPDGVCDGNDAFAALNAFGGLTTCSCPLGGPAPSTPSASSGPAAGSGQAPSTPSASSGQAPSAPSASSGPAAGSGQVPSIGSGSAAGSAQGSRAGDDAVPVVDRVALALVPSVRALRAGGLVDVDVYLHSAAQDLRGYQLHVAASGGTSGQLRLVDIFLRGTGGHSAAGTGGSSGLTPWPAPWSAFNLRSQQMLAGIDGPGTAVPAGTYLATFTYRASDDAAGAFIVDLLHDDPDGKGRTFLFPTPAHARIAIDAVEPAVIEVTPTPPQHRQAARR